MFKLVVLSCVLAVASASAIAPLGWARAGWAGLTGRDFTANLAVPLAAPLATLWAANQAVAAPMAVATPVLGTNYRGPLSLAPGQPANIVAADGRPLDTLSVNLDRAAHYTARALNGVRVLRKRSADVTAAPVSWTSSASIPIPARLAAPLAATPQVGTWNSALWGNTGVWGAPRW